MGDLSCVTTHFRHFCHHNLSTSHSDTHTLMSCTHEIYLLEACANTRVLAHVSHILISMIYSTPHNVGLHNTWLCRLKQTVTHYHFLWDSKVPTSDHQSSPSALCLFFTCTCRHLPTKIFCSLSHFAFSALLIWFVVWDRQMYKVSRWLHNSLTAHLPYGHKKLPLSQKSGKLQQHGWLALVLCLSVSCMCKEGDSQWVARQ